MKIGQGFQPEEGELFRHATFYARYGWTEIVSYVLWSLNRTTVQTARALQATDVKQDFRLAMKPSRQQAENKTGKLRFLYGKWYICFIHIKQKSFVPFSSLSFTKPVKFQ